MAIKRAQARSLSDVDKGMHTYRFRFDLSTIVGIDMITEYTVKANSVDQAFNRCDFMPSFEECIQSDKMQVFCDDKEIPSYQLDEDECY